MSGSYKGISSHGVSGAEYPQSLPDMAMSGSSRHPHTACFDKWLSERVMCIQVIIANIESCLKQNGSKLYRSLTGMKTRKSLFYCINKAYHYAKRRIFF